MDLLTRGAFKATSTIVQGDNLSDCSALARKACGSIECSSLGSSHERLNQSLGDMKGNRVRGKMRFSFRRRRSTPTRTIGSGHARTASECMTTTAPARTGQQPKRKAPASCQGFLLEHRKQKEPCCGRSSLLSVPRYERKNFRSAGAITRPCNARRRRGALGVALSAREPACGSLPASGAKTLPSRASPGGSRYSPLSCRASSQ